MTWILVLILSTGGTDLVGPFSSRGQCEAARSHILYVDREVRDAYCRAER
jgi:hypothetical protein